MAGGHAASDMALWCACAEGQREAGVGIRRRGNAARPGGHDMRVRGGTPGLVAAGDAMPGCPASAYGKTGRGRLWHPRVALAVVASWGTSDALVSAAGNGQSWWMSLAAVRAPPRRRVGKDGRVGVVRGGGVF